MILESKSVSFKNSETLIATCFFVVCKTENVSRTWKEIVEIMDVKKKHFMRCFKQLKSLECIKVLKNRYSNSNAQSLDLEEYQHNDCNNNNNNNKIIQHQLNDTSVSLINRWASQLRMKQKSINIALEIAKSHSNLYLEKNYTATSICAVSIYISRNLEEQLSYSSLSISSDLEFKTPTKTTIINSANLVSNVSGVSVATIRSISKKFTNDMSIRSLIIPKEYMETKIPV